MKKMMIALAICGGLLSSWSRATAATVTVNPAAAWIGYMNVFELPSNGGAFVFGNSWGTADLVATFTGPVLTLSPNTIGDPAPFWYTPSGGPGATGNKTMAASMYVETNGGLLGGQPVTFTGQVVANTLVAPYTVTAFIKDFAPDYSSFTSATAPVVGGVFSITHNTAADSGRHVQYGFETKGPNVWATDVGPMGSMKITAAVPEPASLALAGVCGMAALVLRRRRA